VSPEPESLEVSTTTDELLRALGDEGGGGVTVDEEPPEELDGCWVPIFVPGVESSSLLLLHAAKKDNTMATNAKSAIKGDFCFIITPGQNVLFVLNIYFFYISVKLFFVIFFKTCFLRPKIFFRGGF
jgi:hypothetical protein